MGFIYVLIDPVSEEFCYVGLTKGELQTRLEQHIRESLDPRRIPDAKESWIRSLVRHGMLPRIEIVQELPSFCLTAAEKYWYNRMLERGCPLLNAKVLNDYVTPAILRNKKAPGRWGPLL